jgi:hypothetical protein
MNVPKDSGLRLMGGAIRTLPAVCPLIAIISAYSFLHSLESRVRSALYFLASLTALAATQVRGAEIALTLVLAALGLSWARTSVRSAYIVVSVFMASILVAGVVLATSGGGRIWKTFNRGQDVSDIITASGRTIYWEDLIEYCMEHPKGMDYIAGIRHAHLGKYAMVLHADLTGVGATDNSYIEVLSDAGWLALALYLVMMAKTVLLGLRFVKRSPVDRSPSMNSTRHAIQCALLLLAFCLIEGMKGSDFVTPLRQEFYFQYIFFTIILGASTSMLIASRPRYASLTN